MEDVEDFVYLGSNFNKERGVEADVKRRIQKARQAFIGLRKIWTNTNILERTKLRIFNSNVKSILLYGSETWRLNKSTVQKLQSFYNRCLRRIVNVHWPDTISNKGLYDRTRQQPLEIDLKKRKWRWIGHTMRKPRDNITKRALLWNPQGNRVRGRPRNTWRREVEAEMKTVGMTWYNLEEMARNRRDWRHFVDGLCSTGS